jgi:hypothetical protein
MTPEFRAWIDEAKPVTITTIVGQRGGLHLKRSGRELSGPCPHCQGNDRFSVNIGKDVYNCRGCGGKGKGGIAFLQWLDQIDFIDAVEEITGKPPPHEKKERAAKRVVKKALGPIAATYDYTDELGELVFQVVRHEPKAFRQRRPAPNESGVWINGLDQGEYMRRGSGSDWSHYDEDNFAKWQFTERTNFDATSPVLYRLPDLIEAIACGQTVIIVEGEKDSDTAIEKFGLVATTNPGGAGKWKGRGYAQYFRDADVVVIPDNDEDPKKGLKHANEVAQDLYAVAERVRIAKLPQEFKDLTKWHEAIGTRERLDQIIADAPRYLNGHDPAGAIPQSADTQQTKTIPIVTKSDFLKGFIPPDYLIDGVLQRGFIYAITGQTGHAKTAVALLITELVSSNDANAMLGRYKVEKGRVVYFAGENPDDVRMRVIGADHMRRTAGEEPAQDRIWFVPGQFNITEMRDYLIERFNSMGGVNLIIIDTSAAYFLGKDEIDNVEMGAHARMLRTLTALPGNPCVIPLCHPVKKVESADQLLPRGGGAFLNEVDGNLTLFKKTDDTVELDYTKMRGAGFEPIQFRLERIEPPVLIDKKGRQIPTIRAQAITEVQAQQIKHTVRDVENKVLRGYLSNPDVTHGELCTMYDWLDRNRNPLKSKVTRALGTLAKIGYVRKGRGEDWSLTDKGKEEARKVALAARAAEERAKQGTLI